MAQNKFSLGITLIYRFAPQAREIFQILLSIVEHNITPIPCQNSPLVWKDLRSSDLISLAPQAKILSLLEFPPLFGQLFEQGGILTWNSSDNLRGPIWHATLGKPQRNPYEEGCKKKALFGRMVGFFCAVDPNGNLYFYYFGLNNF